TAHAYVIAHATAAVDECMQLSGGIGFTWQYPGHREQLIGSFRAADQHALGPCDLDTPRGAVDVQQFVIMASGHGIG
ncbi:hypothetical protein JQS35_19000, partial [Alcaligenes faecalis subsp. faecalis]|uniref:hypothetical protein n=1 Tax=Alcaligenes faecalis TaxID=511 RepID=UPI001F211CF3